MNLSNFSGPNAPKIHAGRPSRALLGQSGGGGTKECHFERLPREKLTLLRGLLGHLFVLFVRASRTHKKVSRRAFGNSTVFSRFWDLPGGPQEGSRLHGSSTFTFTAGPKKAPKWEPKWSALGSQIRTILTLGHHLGEVGAQKELCFCFDDLE